MAIFGRDEEPPLPPPEEWQVRLAAALSLIRQNVTDPQLLGRLNDVEAALWAADTDRKRLEAALAQMQPDRANRELKGALRRNFENPSPVNASTASSFQRRHEGIHAMRDRIEELAGSVDETIADVELMAVSSAHLALAEGVAGPVDSDLIDRLSNDLRVLSKVHSDLADI